jgi:hypothetical protein
LPYGPKATLIQIHLDTQAKLLDKPMIELEGSMTSFIKQLQGRSPNGPELRKFKDQAAAIAGALFRFAAVRNERTFQIDAKIVSGFELWYPRHERQCVLFPSFLRLSDEYFSTLREHAVPLDHRAVAAMQHNALMLDIYKWLAQRLCRVPANRPAFIVWPLVQAQFGQGYTRIRAFRSVFIKALKTVVTQLADFKVFGLVTRHPEFPQQGWCYRGDQETWKLSAFSPQFNARAALFEKNHIVSIF